ncbi:MAG: hypothetical protein LKJ25_11235 [Clostridia bacterium]|jgi:Cu/Ag efflux protein CusF|nr:hypothetical protein [Clostridia bacterium]
MFDDEEKFNDEEKKKNGKLFYICFIIGCLIVIVVAAKFIGGKSRENNFYTLTGVVEKVENSEAYVTVENDESNTLENGDEVECDLRIDKLSGQTENGVFTVSNRGDVSKFKAGDEVEIRYLLADLKADKTPKRLSISDIEHK